LTRLSPELRDVRDLLRERRARDEQQRFVAEGPRVVAAARAYGAPGERGDAAGESELTRRAAAAGIEVVLLSEGAAERIGDTVATQAVFAVVRMERAPLDALAGDLVAVAVAISDPGNAGTLMRSAAAAGASSIGLGLGSVDAYNPKVVRASAGACFAIRTVEGVPAVEMMQALGARGVRRLGAVAHGGTPADECNLREPTAIVLGHEVRGVDAELPLDGLVTLPMHAGESLNVAMAATALLFEASRQRRTA
jgi:TrmH family RNA methyltransferase